MFPLGSSYTNETGKNMDNYIVLPARARARKSVGIYLLLLILSIDHRTSVTMRAGLVCKLTISYMEPW